MISRWRSCTSQRIAAPLLAAALLAGCSVGPDYKKPVTAEPPAWRETEAQSAAWPSADWWRGFASTELDGLMTEAQQANYDLGAAVARVREADAQARVAGAALLPTVDAGGGISRQKELVPFNGGKAISFSEFSGGLSASYEIDFWGKNRALLNAAKATALASRYDQQVVALTVVSGVGTTYFQLLGLEDRLQVARANLATAEEVLKVIDGRRQVGTANDLDVSQQATVVDQQRATIPPLQQQIAQTLDALAILIGKTPEQVTIAEHTLDHLSMPVVAPGLPSELLMRRPDIAEAEAQLVAANANIKNARAQFFPSVALSASGGFASLFSGPSAVWSAAAAVSQPIFEGGRLRGQLEFTKARNEELVQNYRKAVISAFGNVEDSLAAVRRTAEQQAAQEATVAEARRSYEIAQARYQIGLTDLLTVLNTENALFVAEDALVQVRQAHLQGLVSLFNSLGGGWELGAPSVVQTTALR